MIAGGNGEGQLCSQRCDRREAPTSSQKITNNETLFTAGAERLKR